MNQNYRIGQVVELKEATKKNVVWSASAAVLLLLVGFGAWSFFSPYTYVSLDVNPSIAYSVNRYGLVLTAEAVNGDGDEILANLDLKYQNIDEALTDTVDEIVDQGYFEGEDPGEIMIAASCKNADVSDELCLRLQTKIREMQKIRECAVNVQGVSIGYDRVQEAKDLGITPGKLNLIDKLKASSDDPESITIEDWMNKSVKDIMHAIKDNKGNGSGGSSDTTDSGNGSGGSSDETTDNNSDSGSENGNNSGGSSDNGNGSGGKKGK